jgi:hypothetical protein
VSAMVCSQGRTTQGLTMNNKSRTLQAPVGMLLRTLTIMLWLLVFVLPQGYGDEQRLASEEARFDIYVAGKKIGQEKFSIEYLAESIRSRSTLNFRDPGNQHQKVRIETQLSMDTQYLPKAYHVETDIDERTVTMKGTFVPGQANFEYQVNVVPRKMGLLVGDRYIILDTNVFHHFTFIGRLFDFGADSPQSINVVIPQELDSGVLKVTMVGTEEVSVRGGKKKLNHLKVDSGRLLIDLWIDSQRILYKIALPAKGIEVVRG